MNAFVCVLANRRTDLPAHVLWGDDARLAHEWTMCGPCSARVVNDGRGPVATLVRSPGGLAVGVVRLDNRQHISRLAACSVDQPDLAIIVACLVRRGETCIHEFEGDFAFTYWDDTRRTLIVARDAFGARTLFRVTGGECSAFASRAGLLAINRPYSLDFIADYFVDNASSIFSPYEGVTRFPPATYLMVRDERRTERRYWSAHQFDTMGAMDHGTAVEQFKTLFSDAVRLHLLSSRGCWSQLSGGIDSSSVVSMAAWLSRRDAGVPPLEGTLTFADTLGSADERRYSDAVVSAWSLRNEQLIDYGMWQDDEGDPPLTDEPDMTYPWFARDEAVCRTVRDSGSSTLLTGVGPDQYLNGTWHYFADRVAKGHIASTAREMYRMAVFAKISFWRFAYHNAIRPLLPRFDAVSQRWPEWIRPSFARTFPIEAIVRRNRLSSGRVGRCFITEAANQCDCMEHSYFRGVVGETLDMRYPYLHRPLVEFCLQLPPEMIIRPRVRKWILREAMRGILPDMVQQRLTKGFLNGRMERSFAVQRQRLNELLEHSVLAELNCIDVRRAQRALSQGADAGSLGGNTLLRHMLTIETWLTARSGQWAARKPIQTGRLVKAHETSGTTVRGGQSVLN